eukprot:TRINITY_DN743_c0_g1_i3.p1 TRINITY_DN743_c0_g1~~TRINITY_DN743_c0_g1_i3.p1  ORF type:complete len:378 (-),score=85.52 TRINITY_DN743_c0_g1_i3:487-1620(-)
MQKHMLGGEEEFGAFIEKFTLPPPSKSPQLPLHSLTFAVKDIFDIKGYVTGFGNPDWARTHEAATSTAPSVLAILDGGATSVGKTVMDEMAYSIDGEHKHYGTPTNPCAPDRIPGGSSSGSAVAVAAELVDFSLGTDTGGSVRVPAAFCGILGFRPSHGVVSTVGVIPMAQSFDTVGEIVNHIKLGDYVEDKVPSLKHFMSTYCQNQEYTVPSLMALSNALLLLQRFEFKNNHGEWVSTVKPDLGPGIFERVWEALKTTDEDTDRCQMVITELRAALSDLLQDSGILAIPTVPGPPPKLHTEVTALESYRARAFSLLAISGMSGLCQVTIPLGMHNNLPVAVSLLARHGGDQLLLNLVQTIYGTLKEQVSSVEKLSD